MTRKCAFGISALAAIMILLCSPSSSNGARQQPSAATRTSAAKVLQLMKESGFSYKTVSDSVWTMELSRASLGTFRVLIGVQNEQFVAGVVIAEKAKIPMTVDFMHKIASLGNNLDYVKVGLDDDGDAYVRVEAHTRVLDLVEFKSDIEQMADAADKAFAAIKGDLRK
jgi:hypothetical protein